MVVRKYITRDKTNLGTDFLNTIKKRYPKVHGHADDILKTLLTEHPEILKSKKLKNLIQKLSNEMETELYQIQRGKLSSVSDNYKSYCTHPFETLLSIAKYSSSLITNQEIEEILGRIKSEKMILHLKGATKGQK